MLKVNPGTQIRVSPSLCRDTEQAHSIFDVPSQIRVIKFFEIFIFGGKFQKNKILEILKLFKCFVVSCE